MKLEVNIDNYLSEQEKKDIVIEAFKEVVKNEILDGNGANTIQSDTEIQRVIGNISHHVVMREVQQYIPDFEKLIKDKVNKAISSDSLNYQIFKTKDVWDSKESLAVTYINEEVRNCKEILKQRVRSEISNYDLSNIIRDEVSSVFEEMAGNLYKLSELFQSNNKD